MSRLKRMLLMMVTLITLLTFSFSSSAIGFKAEEKYSSIFVITSGQSLGSGFAVGENCIITNAHVISNPKEVHIETYEGQQYDAGIWCIDSSLDIAVLQVTSAKFKPLTIANYADSDVGSDVYTIGAPNSMAYTLTKGILSAKDRQIGGEKYLQLDAPINPGNSGGPLLNDEGKVIGVNTLKIGESEGIGLAIPMTTVQEYLKQNGIKLNSDGNVADPLSEEKIADSSVLPNDTSLQKPVLQNWFFALILGGAILLTGILVVVIIYRNRTLKPKLDKSDRTDFDIDIF